MSKRGFTLVEVLVAMVVLSVGLLALAKMSVVYVRASTQSHQASLLNTVAQDKVEQLRGLATSDRSDAFSLLDFDYLVSTEKDFQILADGTAVSGYLSGSNGGAAATSLKTKVTYDVLTYDGTRQLYAGRDTVLVSSGKVSTTTPQGFTVDRAWTVKPIDVDVPADGQYDFALIAVDTSWDDWATPNPTTGTRPYRRTAHLESIVHRRQ